MKKNNKKKKRNILVYFILILGLLLIYAHYMEPNNLIIKEYKIESDVIPKSFDGIKIIHFSDTHYGGSIIDKKYINKIINTINNENPDIVIFTGDFFDKRAKLDDDTIKYLKEELGNIKSNIGNFAVNGNHDIKFLETFNSIFEDNFIILNNEEKLLYYKEETPISIVGLTDKSETKVDYSILEKENNYYRIILAHEPDEYENIKEYTFNLLLSGHSHNGQIKLPFIGAIYTPVGAKKYYDDHYILDNREIFVSSGIGTSTIDFRLNSKPSINLYRLYAHK